MAWGVASRRFSIRPEMIPSFAFLFGASGVLAGLYLFFRGFQLLQRKRWIQDTPITRISAAALGPVKIFGRATGPYTLLSPLAGVDCCYYRAVASSGRESGNNKELEKRVEEVIFTPLFVEDETGQLMLDPRQAQLDLPNEYDETISEVSMSEGARRFLRRHGLSTSSATKVSECVIKPGDPLLVLGTLREVEGSPDGYLSPEAADLQRREQLEAMGLPENAVPREDSSSTRQFDLHPKVIVGFAGDSAPFILSRENPEHLIANLTRNSVLDIWGGPALALFSLGLLLQWLGIW